MQKTTIPSHWISICKLGTFKNPFAMITSLSKLYFRLRRFIVDTTKKVIFTNYGSSTSSWKPRDDWDFTWYLQWGMYTSIPTWTHSQNSLAAAKALSLKISSHRISIKWSQRLSNQHKNSHKLCDETRHLVLSLTESQQKLRQPNIRFSQWRENHCRTNNSIRRNK